MTRITTDSPMQLPKAIIIKADVSTAGYVPGGRTMTPVIYKRIKVMQQEPSFRWCLKSCLDHATPLCISLPPRLHDHVTIQGTYIHDISIYGRIAQRWHSFGNECNLFMLLCRCESVNDSKGQYMRIPSPTGLRVIRLGECAALLQIDVCSVIINRASSGR